jgi:hypothetical protein
VGHWPVLRSKDSNPDPILFWNFTQTPTTVTHSVTSQTSKMKTKIAAILILVLFAGPLAAELIQSTTGVHATFRECVKGETACDSIGRTKANGFAGLPGNSESQTSLQSYEFGSSSGRVKLLESPGASEMTATMKSLPGARNGGNSFMMQRYTNTSATQETLTLNSTLTFDLTVPAENADFPAEGGAHSNASSEMEIFTLNIDAIEAGTTAIDNNQIMMGEEPPGMVYVSLEVSKVSAPENVTGSGSESASITASIAPGNSVWIFAILQSLGANGAEVEASLETSMTIEVGDE